LIWITRICLLAHFGIIKCVKQVPAYKVTQNINNKGNRLLTENSDLSTLHNKDKRTNSTVIVYLIEQISSVIKLLLLSGNKQQVKTTVFNDQSLVQIGGRQLQQPKRIDRPFVGIMAGIVYNSLKPLDLVSIIHYVGIQSLFHFSRI